MIEVLKGWNGNIEVDGRDVKAVTDAFVFRDNMVIILNKTEKSSETQIANALDETKQYKITVRSYMTKKATPSFDFMAKWNNDIPMPLMTMVGTYDKETPGMYHMTLHGDILEEQTQYCLCCGKEITNPVSQYFGMGPKCGQHNYVNPFNTEEELKSAVKEYRKKLNNMVWEGWVIKSAITDMQEI